MPTLSPAPIFSSPASWPSMMPGMQDVSDGKSVDASNNFFPNNPITTVDYRNVMLLILSVVQRKMPAFDIVFTIPLKDIVNKVITEKEAAYPHAMTSPMANLANELTLRISELFDVASADIDKTYGLDYMVSIVDSITPLVFAETYYEIMYILVNLQYASEDSTFVVPMSINPMDILQLEDTVVDFVSLCRDRVGSTGTIASSTTIDTYEKKAMAFIQKLKSAMGDVNALKMVLSDIGTVILSKKEGLIRGKLVQDALNIGSGEANVPTFTDLLTMATNQFTNGSIETFYEVAIKPFNDYYGKKRSRTARTARTAERFYNYYSNNEPLTRSVFEAAFNNLFTVIPKDVALDTILNSLSSQDQIYIVQKLLADHLSVHIAPRLNVQPAPAPASSSNDPPTWAIWLSIGGAIFLFITIAALSIIFSRRRK